MSTKAKIYFYLIPIIIISLNTCLSDEVVNKHKCSPNINIQKGIAEYAKNKNYLANLDFGKPLKPSWTQSDLLILRKILQEANPNLYRYQDKQSLDDLFESHLCLLEKPIGYLEFIKLIADILNHISDGHSSWSHNPDYYAYRDSSMKFFPLRIFPEGNKYFVEQNNSSDTTIQVGDEILSINKLRPKELNTVLRSHMYKDGCSATNAVMEIGMYFENAYSNFIGNPDTFSLKIKDIKGTTRRVSLTAQSKGFIDSLSSKRYGSEKSMGTPLLLKVDSSISTAIYTIKWFRNEYIEYMNQDFNQFTDSVFKVLSDRSIHHLIIDLRGNPGGWTANGKKLFSYFIDNPMNYITKVELSEIDNFSFQPLILSDRALADSMQFRKNESGLYEWLNYPSLMVLPAKENRYYGKLYILIDEMSRSATSIFASLMQSHSNALFIGEENAAAQSGQSGMPITAILPYTGIIVTSSTAKYSSNVNEQKSCKGIKPDYWISQEWMDEQMERDAAMDFVQKLIYDANVKAGPRTVK